jgi:hypothetical protein
MKYELKPREIQVRTGHGLTAMVCLSRPAKLDREKIRTSVS